MEQHISCSLCGYSAATTMADYLKHIRLLHADMPGFSIQCYLQGCQRKTYKSFQYFRNHMYDFHSNVFRSHSGVPQPNGSGCSTSPTHNPTSETRNDDSHTLGFSGDESGDRSDTHANNDTELQQDLQRAAALWILKTRECNRLPLSTMDAIIQDVDSLYEVALGLLHDDVQKALIASGVDPQTVPGLNLIFHRNGPRGKLFSGLETQYQQLQYFRHNFQFVEPRTIVLGTRIKAKGHGSKRIYYAQLTKSDILYEFCCRLARTVLNT